MALLNLQAYLKTMIIHRGYESLHPSKPVITIGVFDGVHRGHQALLRKLVSVAQDTGGESVVLTFSSHPRNILGNDELFLLTTPEEKISLLEKAGIDHVMILDFDVEFSRTSACDFVENILVKKIGARHLIFGYDHRFGREGEGDFDRIVRCDGLSGLEVEQAEGIFIGDSAISSSAIREALRAGDLDLANELLGYSYSISGSVIAGKQIGRSLGFPTANIDPESGKMIPANGVYAVNVILEKDTHIGMLSIGTNPTVNPDSTLRSIEVHLIDFDKNIYDKKVTVIFRKRLRGEKKFPDTDCLKKQMEDDRIETIRLLS